jgi:hypothetical protein
MFREYIHIEKFGNTEVEGIELGTTYVFPKIDGTNASTYFVNGTDVYIGAASRKRSLSLDSDNAGFCAFVYNNNKLTAFHEKHQNLRLYGEWLVPHTLKTYREDAWRRFYIFDVYNDDTEQYLTYEAYQPLLEEFGLDYLAPIAIIKNGSSDQFFKCLEQNNFLIKDGEGQGEGIVLKNYDFFNRYSRQVWAKFITSEFKMAHHKAMGAPEIGTEPVELKIANEYITEHFVGKVVAKITVEHGGWTSKWIPRLLETVFYDLIKEEMYEIIKAYKNPAINFKALRAFVTGKIKEVKPELF